MLLGFRVANFLSFNEVQSFNTISGDYQSHTNHLMKIGDVEALRTAFIYGPNSSGKTNFISAIEYARLYVNGGYKGLPFYLDKYGGRPLNNRSNGSLESFFEFIIQSGSKTLVYGMYVNTDCRNVMREYAYDITNGLSVIFNIDYSKVYDLDEMELGNEKSFVKRYSILHRAFSSKSVNGDLKLIADAIDNILVVMDDEIPLFQFKG